MSLFPVWVRILRRLDDWTGMGNKLDKAKHEKASCNSLPSRPFQSLRFGGSNNGCINPTTSGRFSNSARVITQLRHGRNTGHFEEREATSCEEVHCCLFVPDDENFLVSSSTPCDPRNEEGLGHLRYFNVNTGLCSKEILTYHTQECDISTDGELISFTMNSGQGEIAAVKRIRYNRSGLSERLQKFQPQCNGITGQTLGCQFSPDGNQLLSVASLDFHTIRETNELRLWNVRSLQLTKKVLLRDLTDFCGFVTSCKFSPDGHYIACTTSQEQLCILRAKNLDMVSILRKRCRGNMCWCVFDPRRKHEVLACCLQDGRVEIWRAQDTPAYPGIPYTCDKQSKISSLKRLYSCQYSPDGSMIAVGTSDATIIMLHSDDLNKLYLLDCKVPGSPFSPSSHNVTVHCVAFSKSLQFAAAGYSDGLVRVWALPYRFDLQHLCRLAILRHVAPRKVHTLPLPSSLKGYLLLKAK